MRSVHPFLFCAAIFLGALPTRPVQAQLNITSTGLVFSQNFNVMSTTANSNTVSTLPAGFRVSTGTDWSAGTSATTAAAGTSGTGVIASNSAGGTYNFAQGVMSSSTDRALGFLSSSTFASPRSIILQMTNSTGLTINQLDITFDYEKYRSGTRQVDWTFFHGATTAPATAAATGNQTYAANANTTTVSNPPTTISKSLSLTGLSIPNGGNYYLRWTYTGLAGSTNTQALGIDNFTVTAIQDTDGDGVPDDIDPCPLLANLAPGNACDDGNPLTSGDVVSAGCVCAGTLGNDDCAGALWLGAAQAYGNCSATASTTLGATSSGTLSCLAGSPGDVWFYSYVASGQSHAFIDLAPGSAIGMGIEVRDLSCQGSVTYCASGNQHLVPVQSGQYFYFRVFSTTPGTFTVCAQEPVGNDDCPYASYLGYPQPFGTCSGTSGTTVGATSDGFPPCTGSTISDVWYYFTSNFNTHCFIDLTESSAAGSGIQVYEGGNCGGASVYCGTGLHHTVQVVPGSNYWIKVFTITPGSFSLCVTDPVGNDDCPYASYLGYPQPFGTCSGTSGTTVGATSDGFPPCTGSTVSDVWYYFTSNFNTHCFIDLTESSAAGSGIQVYEGGNCGGASVYCGTGLHHTVQVVPGSNYWIKVFTITPGSFSLCVTDPVGNDDCPYATYLGYPQPFGTCSGTSGTTVGATSDGFPPCIGSTVSDVWYYFTSNFNTHCFIDLTESSAAGSGIQVYEGGNCGGASVYCGTGLHHTVQVVPGSNYWIKVFTIPPGSFSLCVTDPVGNDDCTNAIGLPTTYNSVCNATSGSTTASTSEGLSSCGGGSVNGLWYTYYNPDAAELTVSLASAGATGLGLEVFTTCGGTSVYCGSGTQHTFVASPGTTYWLRAYSEVGGGFTICCRPAASQFDCHNDYHGNASIDLCGVCSGGATGLVPDASCSDCAGVPNGPSLVDGCGICRLPNDPGFVTTYQTMTFSGNGGFTTALLAPTIGSPTTTYTAQVKYTNSANSLPAYGYPRLILDYEGNGVFNDPNDRSVVMSPMDLGDLTTSDGKLYSVTITGLAVGSNWQARVQAFAGICVQDFGPFNYPDVLQAPDLQLFANDITFSEPNPGVSSPLTVRAVVHNTSDYPIISPVAHLVNQFTPATVYADVVLNTIPAHGTDTAVWNIITPAEVAWCPMEVTVDPANTIAETNELNNQAIRPFINGPYNLPGGIHVYAQTSPEESCFTPSSQDQITVYGYAYYYGTAVPLQDSSVAGATVTLWPSQGGAPISAYTNSQGFFSASVPAENAQGTFPVLGEVTNFTLTGSISETYDRVPCPTTPPDLYVSVVLDDSQLFTGESASGQIIVYNAGTQDITQSTLLDIQQSGGTPVLQDVQVPALAAGASFAVPFSGILFSTPGIFSFCATADALDVVVEANESNNTDCAVLTVVDPAPDLVPWAFGAGSGNLCEQQQPVFVIANLGTTTAAASTTRVQVLLNNAFVQSFDHPTPALTTGEFHQFTIPYTYPSPGTFTFELSCDIPLPNGVVPESSENNNTAIYGHEMVGCGPDITVGMTFGSTYLCEVASPEVVISNIGLLPTGPFDCTIAVRRDGLLQQTFTPQITDIGPGGTVVVPVAYSYPAAGTYAFEVVCDAPLPDGVVVETNESNNTGTFTLALAACKPDLSTSFPCNVQNVLPTDPQFPGTVTYSTVLSNGGNANAVNPVVRFDWGAAHTDVAYSGTLVPGNSVTLTTTVPSVAPATAVLTASADPAAAIDELAENNNSVVDNLCWEFQPVPLVDPCGSNFWDVGYNRDQSIPMYVGVSVSHLYWASQVKVRFSVSGPGVPGTVVLGDALLNNVHQTCYCPYVAALPNSFIPSQGGVYTFTMTVDPDGVYTECDEANNVLVAQVTVTDRPDLRVLSQFIAPSQLNPDPNEAITFNVSYENIGISNLTDQFDLKVLVDEQLLATIPNVPGLLSGTNNTVPVPVPFSSDLVGIHVVRLIVDANNVIDEADELNNEATRAFIVGASANLYFTSLTPSDGSPAVGQSINLNAVVANNGDLPIDAEVWFYRILGNDTTFIGISPVSVEANSSVPVQRAYTVPSVPMTILARIKNPTGLEFDDTDNDALLFLGTYDVAITAVPGCPGVSFGSLTASASGGTAPYTYLWSTGQVGATLLGVPGTYTVTVTDAAGLTSIAEGTIESDPNCTAIPVRVAAKVKLEGPYVSATGLMNDALRGLAGFPQTDPYPGLGYTHVGVGNNGSAAPAALAVTGDNAIVDWVLVELRSAVIPSIRVATRSALLQRDGDVVGTDGTSPVSFSVAPGNYHVAVRHRNHLGCMTATPVALSVTPAPVDFTTLSTVTYGANARKSVGGAVAAQVLWAGDVSFNHVIKYTGSGNDRDPVLVTVGSTTPNNIVSAYSTRDVNLNGQVKYTGSGNDRDPILVNVGSTTPNNLRVEQIP